MYKENFQTFNTFSQGQTLFDLSTGCICVYSLPFNYWSMSCIYWLCYRHECFLFCQRSCCPLTLRCWMWVCVSGGLWGALMKTLLVADPVPELQLHGLINYCSQDIMAIGVNPYSGKKPLTFSRDCIKKKGFQTSILQWDGCIWELCTQSLVPWVCCVVWEGSGNASVVRHWNGDKPSVLKYIMLLSLCPAYCNAIMNHYIPRPNKYNQHSLSILNLLIQHVMYHVNTTIVKSILDLFKA